MKHFKGVFRLDINIGNTKHQCIFPFFPNYSFSLLRAHPLFIKLALSSQVIEVKMRMKVIWMKIASCTKQTDKRNFENLREILHFPSK